MAVHIALVPGMAITNVTLHFRRHKREEEGGKRNECMIDAEYFGLPRAKETGAV